MTLLKILSIPVVFMTLGMANCQQKPDAWIGTFIKKEPLESSYTYSKNIKTDAAKETPVQNMNGWICTDPDSYETMRKFYKDQCKSN